MTITINGESRRFEDAEKLTVTELLGRLELGPRPVLVELDGEALFQRDFDARTVSEGSEVEIIQMVAGG